MPVVRATGKQRQEDCHELEASLGYLVRPSCLKITKQSVGRISAWTWDPARRRRDNPLSVWGQLEQRDRDNVFMPVGINSQLNVFMYICNIANLSPALWLGHLLVAWGHTLGPRGRELADPGPVFEGSWEKAYLPDIIPDTLGISGYQAQDIRAQEPRCLLVSSWSPG